jgi:hypothetical protein
MCRSSAGGRFAALEDRAVVEVCHVASFLSGVFEIDWQYQKCVYL